MVASRDKLTCEVSWLFQWKFYIFSASLYTWGTAIPSKPYDQDGIAQYRTIFFCLELNFRIYTFIFRDQPHLDADVQRLIDSIITTFLAHRWYLCSQFYDGVTFGFQNRAKYEPCPLTHLVQQGIESSRQTIHLAPCRTSCAIAPQVRIFLESLWIQQVFSATTFTSSILMFTYYYHVNSEI